MFNSLITGSLRRFSTHIFPFTLFSTRRQPAFFGRTKISSGAFCCVDLKFPNFDRLINFNLCSWWRVKETQPGAIKTFFNESNYSRSRRRH